MTQRENQSSQKDDPRQHRFRTFDACVLAHAVWLRTWTLKELHRNVSKQWASVPHDVWKALSRLQRKGRLFYEWNPCERVYRLIEWEADQ